MSKDMIRGRDPSATEVALLGAYGYSFSLKRFIKFVGPGLLMSIAYVVSQPAGRAHCVSSLPQH